MYAIRSYYGTQGRIDGGSQTIVGINKYRLEKEDPIDILDIDNTAVRLSQIERLKKLRGERNEEEVQASLAARITSYNVCYTKLLRAQNIHALIEAAWKYGQYQHDGSLKRA